MCPSSNDVHWREVDGDGGSGARCPRTEERKGSGSLEKKGCAGGMKKTGPIGAGMLRLLSQATGCRDNLYPFANVIRS